MKINNDIGILLGYRRYGESFFILSILTKDHGLYKGLFRPSKKHNVLLQIGNVLSVKWQARLQDSLGRFSCELVSSYFDYCFDDNLKLLVLKSFSSLLLSCLPEREIHKNIYKSCMKFLLSLKGQGWQSKYIYFELQLLSDLGYGLTIDKCAVSGSKNVDDLSYISPKTGCAVVQEVGIQYKDRLINYPAAFRSVVVDDDVCLSHVDVVEALCVTGFFLEKNVWCSSKRRIPEDRSILIQKLNK